jgi:ATP-binding cassette, subfamily B, bacterial
VLPFYPQETDYSCVPACLRMVMASLGIQVDEATLRVCCETDPKGTASTATILCALSYGLYAFETSNASWSELVHWIEQNVYPIVYINLFPLDMVWGLHAVVVEAITKDTVIFLDPLVGRRQATLAPFEQAWQMSRQRMIVVTTT